MKKLLICLFLSAAICAPSETRAAPAKPQKVTLQWPTFRQTAAKKSVPDVTAIQYLLRARGFYHSKPDGVFGAQTAASVRAFQRKNGLKADGIVAAQTFTKLIKVVKRGDKGDAVRALQTILNDTLLQSEVHGIDPVRADGIFGSQTETAIRVHQGVLETNRDGIVGVPIWCSLFGGQLN